MDILNWLGFSWPEPVRQQSDHFDLYAEQVAELAARGLAYRCFRTRAELKQAPTPFIGAPLSKDEERARLTRGEAFAWRLSLAAAREQLGSRWPLLSYQLMRDGRVETRQADPMREGDIVLARKDSPSAYHLAASCDDALQGITHIIRGEDLSEAPHIQTLLQALMNWPQPIYQHHPLVLDAQGRKLSKRANSPTLAALRTSGITPEQIWERLNLEPFV